jgi:hypothetical protein
MYETVSRKDKFRGSGRKDRAGVSLIGLPEHTFPPEGYNVVEKPQGPRQLDPARSSE